MSATHSSLSAALVLTGFIIEQATLVTAVVVTFYLA
jgi:hypothetical protein